MSDNNDASEGQPCRRGTVPDLNFTEAALHASEAAFRTLVSQVKDYAIFGMDPEGRAVSWNEGVEAVLGYREAEFIGSPVEVLFLPEDIEAEVPWRELADARERGVADNDRWLRRKDGAAFFATGRTTRLTDADGRHVGFSKVLRDDTRLALATQQLHTSETRIRTLLRNLRDYAIVMTDPQGVVTEWSEGAQQITGYMPEEALGKHIAFIHTPEDVASGALAEAIERARRDGRAERETWHVRKNGERFWANEIASAVHDHRGKLIGFAKISRDLTRRKRSEENSAYLAALMEHSPVAIIGMRSDGTVQTCNSAAEQLFGYAPDELLGRNIADLVPENLLAEQAEKLKPMRRGKIVRLETALLHRDGHAVPVLLTAGPVRNPAGEMIGVSSSLLDISALKRTEAALRVVQSRQAFLLGLGDQLRSLTDPLAIKAVTCRLLGEKLGVNRVYCAEFGTDQNSLTIEGDYYHGATSVAGAWHIEAYGSRIANAFRRGATVVINDVAIDVRIEEEARPAYSELQICACVGVPLVRQGKLIMMIAALQMEPRQWSDKDISLIQEAAERSWEAVERARAEALLRQSEERLRRALSIETVGVIYFHPEGPIVEANDAFLHMSGFERADVTAGALSWQKLTPPEFMKASLDAVDEFEATGHTTPYEKQYFRKDGTRWWGLFAATRLPDGSGVEFIVDVTQRKALEGSLREADRRKDEFIATLGHELRNPLAPIRNGLQIARIAAKRDPPLQRTVEMMDRQLTHLVHLVDDLLDLGRISAGKIELRKTSVTLNELIVTSVEASRALIDARSHELVVSTPQEALFVKGDFERLSQVISNLLSNAAKYTENGGHIQLSLQRQDGDAVVEVTDDGIGIPALELPRVFDLFSQVRIHQGRYEGGLGIGLSLVKSLVSMHGGMVEVRSEGNGRGSTFTVRLPLCEPSAAERSRSNTMSVPSSHVPPRRILIADDNPDAASTLAALLEVEGHEVYTASDGAEAVDVIRSFQPDIVILDLGMPRMDGLEAAKRIRALEQGEPILLVALTGWGQESDRERTRAAGFDRHLVKPIDPNALMHLLAERNDGRPPPPDRGSGTHLSH